MLNQSPPCHWQVLTACVWRRHLSNLGWRVAAETATRVLSRLVEKGWLGFFDHALQQVLNNTQLWGLTSHSLFFLSMSISHTHRPILPHLSSFPLIHWFSPVGKMRVLWWKDEALAEGIWTRLELKGRNYSLLYNLRTVTAPRLKEYSSDWKVSRSNL